MEDQARLDVHVRKNIGGKDSHELRKAGSIPGEIYGRGQENIHITVNAKDFGKIFKTAGASALVDLAIDGKDPQKVLIQDVQRDPESMEPLHVDFYAVNMSEKLKASVPLEIVGVAPAVKNHGAILVTVKDEIEVQCLPKDLPAKIVVDISGLAELESRIRVSNIDAGEGVTFLADPSDSLVVAESPRTEEELAKLDEAVEDTVDEVEVEGAAEGEDEGAEGEEKKEESGDAKPADDKDKKETKEG